MADNGERTTIIERGGNGGMIFLAIVLVILIGAGLMMFGQYNQSSVSKNDAITHAVKQAGNAAQDVGDAAKKTAQ